MMLNYKWNMQIWFSNFFLTMSDFILNFTHTVYMVMEYKRLFLVL